MEEWRKIEEEVKDEVSIAGSTRVLKPDLHPVQRVTILMVVAGGLTGSNVE